MRSDRKTIWLFVISVLALGLGVIVLAISESNVDSAFGLGTMALAIWLHIESIGIRIREDIVAELKPPSNLLEIPPK